MAKKKRLSPNEIAQEKRNFENLKNIEGYRSQKPEYEVAAIQVVENALDEALSEEAVLLTRLDEVRDVIAEKSNSLAEKNDGSVIQVAAQFGEDSFQFQSLGRKRKSERSTGKRSGNTGNTNG